MESVRYKGITYRRYPESDNLAHRSYYRPGQGDTAKGYDSLHRQIWKDNNGPIPEGYDIHHADFNVSNNEPSNLVCLSKAEHQAAHKGRPSSQKRLDHLSSVRHLAAAWHSTPAGREWHRAHGAEVMANRKTMAYVCEQCGSEAQSISPGRFCSNKCKAAWRRASGVDDEYRVCHCGVTFRVNRYSKQKQHSRSCRAGATVRTTNTTRKA